MLDVSAVAEVLLAKQKHSSAAFDAICWLTALHDLGKVNSSFRSMLLYGERQTLGRHWEVTEALLNKHAPKLECLGVPSRGARLLFAAVAGHHGSPPTKQGDKLRQMVEQAGTEAVEDAGMIVSTFAKLWPEASLTHLEQSQLRSLCWWLPGFITAADWIGSNSDWFPATEPGPDPFDYLKLARGRAQSAVSKAGLSLAAPKMMSLLPDEPRPMQLATAKAALPDGPTLAIIEDGTGSGKTEAALILAQRMLTAKKAQGLYFALPTMATSDAMFHRIELALPNMFETAPTFTLAHGRADLSERYRDLQNNRTQSEDEAGPTTWLADSRRRALLAQIGVGTIDQALLAVLKAKHFPLRLYALASKILIVDEVHEVGEPYMDELLQNLLRAHRQNGGSAILLTATLPVSQRNALLRAWGATVPSEAPYPALTIAEASPVTVEPMRDHRGPVQIRRLGDQVDALDHIALHAQGGAACLWVRNAVDDAIAATRALRERGIEADLLHARFAFCDRQAHQSKCLRRFGKSRDGGARRVLVATQIVEASLDLDFDVMVSDLAPISSLIQRAGRLWRHMDKRPKQDRPVPEPVLHVLSPDPDQIEDDRWLARVLDRGAFTYPLDLQWRTAKALFEFGRIKTPEDLRPLIEAVFDAEEMPVPDAILRAEMERVGDGMARQSRAAANMLILGDGYRKAGCPGSDESYPTRLGIPQQVMALARWDGEILRPWAQQEGSSETELWMLSELSASERSVQSQLPDQTLPGIEAVKADWPDWKRASVAVCPVVDEGISDGLHYSRDWGLLTRPPIFGDDP